MQVRTHRWLNVAVLLLLGGWIAVVPGCLKDGTDGKNGADGANGANGHDGTDGPTGPTGTAECMQCHNDDFTSLGDTLLTIKADFRESQHYLGDTYLRSDNPCSRCHSNEGFQKFLATGTVGAVANATKIGCFTCHAPHTNRSFALRKTNATTFDLNGLTYDKGESNTCVQCHQARVPKPSVAADSAVTSGRWGPHHGVQGNIYAGNGAWDFGTAFTETQHAHDSVPKGCVTCHMAGTPTEQLMGGHTFRTFLESNGTLNTTSCVDGCHGSVNTLNARVTAWKAEFDAAVTAIHDKMVADSLIIASNGQVYKSPTHPYPSDHDVKGVIFNYLMLTEDLSHGIHNPTYTAAIIAKCKTYLGIS